MNREWIFIPHIFACKVLNATAITQTGYSNGVIKGLIKDEIKGNNTENLIKARAFVAIRMQIPCMLF